MYSPQEDSFFLSEVLSEYCKKIKRSILKNLKACDIGTGTGIQAETLAKFIGRKNILCIDIDRQSIEHVKLKGFKAVESDLFKKVKGKFDIIVFNAPYLPSDKHDRERDTTGGKRGDETILRFLKQVKKYLENEGKIFLVFSSKTPQERIIREIERNKLKVERVHEKRIFFEKLFVFVLAEKFKDSRLNFNLLQIRSNMAVSPKLIPHLSCKLC